MQNKLGTKCKFSVRLFATIVEHATKSRLAALQMCSARKAAANAKSRAHGECDARVQVARDRIWRFLRFARENRRLQASSWLSCSANMRPIMRCLLPLLLLIGCLMLRARAQLLDPLALYGGGNSLYGGECGRRLKGEAWLAALRPQLRSLRKRRRHSKL